MARETRRHVARRALVATCRVTKTCGGLFMRIPEALARGGAS